MAVEKNNMCFCVFSWVDTNLQTPLDSDKVAGRQSMADLGRGPRLPSTEP